MSVRRRGGSAPSPDVDGSDEWTDSSAGSSDSDSDSSAPEWEADVAEDGELLFVQYEEPSQGNPTSDAACDLASAPSALPAYQTSTDVFYLRNEFKRSSTRRASKGKIFKVLRNHYRNAKKTSPQNPQEQDVCSSTSDLQPLPENCSHITIQVERNNFFYSEKRCQLEQMFGISVQSEDGKLLTVSSFLPEARPLYETKVKRGFCLQKINGLDVTPTNIYAVLDNVKCDLRKYTLTFRAPPQESLSIEFKNLLVSKTEHDFFLSQVLREASVAVVYTCCDASNESTSDERGVLYCYPRPCTQNFLYNSRGAFITLNHLTQKGLSLNAPLSSVILVGGVLVNVSYVQRGDELMLLAIPQRSADAGGARMATEQTVRLLEFQFGSLGAAFSEPTNLYKIDRLFSRLFAMIACGFEGADAPSGVRPEELAHAPRPTRFEHALPLAHAITLPGQVRLQIDDALSEFEAADYREWTDDPLNCQRLLVVTGCCLFYSGYLLSSHLPDEELRDVHSFLRLGGLLQLSRLAPARLLLWREVFVSAQRRQRCPDSSDDEYRVPEGRSFLLIVGKGNFLLASIMEAGGCTEEAEAHPSPSPFYVEEAESCLTLLLELGLDRLLAGWLQANCRPQLQLQPHGRSSDGGVGPPVDISKSSALKPPSGGGAAELHSILKRRHHSSEQIHALAAGGTDLPARAASQHSLHAAAAAPAAHDASYSEDSTSQKSASETNDERVARRRAVRERGARRRDSSGSDSEWGGQTGSRASGGLDSEVRRSLLDELNQLTVHRVTAGEENVLLHYVQLESARGVLLAPVAELEAGARSALYSYILSAFRAAARKIHALLQNTMRLKSILSPASLINKSLVAVRERGMLLRAPAHLVPRAATPATAADIYQFWVVGRLFSEPEHKEVYVCYHESVPQDVLEVAYRLSFLE